LIAIFNHGVHKDFHKGHQAYPFRELLIYWFLPQRKNEGFPCLGLMTFTVNFFKAVFVFKQVKSVQFGVQA
jgi:hypothetical protein